jgi:hypothetical protein
MELHSLPTLSLWSLVHDALVVVGVAVALLIGFVFINFGLLLPGLFTWLDGHHRDAREEYLEFGPVAAPTISEPAPRRVEQAQRPPAPHRPVRSPIWHRLSGGMAFHLVPPRDAVKQ